MGRSVEENLDTELNASPWLIFTLPQPPPSIIICVYRYTCIYVEICVRPRIYPGYCYGVINVGGTGFNIREDQYDNMRH